jgi:hypothetical protein
MSPFAPEPLSNSLPLIMSFVVYNSTREWTPPHTHTRACAHTTDSMLEVSDNNKPSKRIQKHQETHCRMIDILGYASLTKLLFLIRHLYVSGG